MTDNLVELQSFKLKGRLYTLTVLQLLEPDIKAFNEQLDDLIQKAPRLFEHAPIVLDCEQVQEDKVDLNALCDALKKRSLFPVGVQGGSEPFKARANAAGLTMLRASGTRDKRVNVEVIEPRDVEPKQKAAENTKFITSPVRSGQQVVSSGDLIITASVGRGAELLAEGHIHVYGALRGRALAGISGDTTARIFCQSLDPELVAIAGIYRLPETISPDERACQVFLKNERIEIERI